MNKGFILVIAAAVWWVGCGKEPTPAPPQKSPVAKQVEIAAPVQPGPAATVPVPAPGALAPAAAVTNHAAETPDRVKMRMERLADAIRTFRKDNERYPEGIQELVRAGYLSKVPPAPAGKRYEIDSKTGGVSLVSN